MLYDSMQNGIYADVRKQTRSSITALFYMKTLYVRKFELEEGEGVQGGFSSSVFREGICFFPFPRDKNPIEEAIEGLKFQSSARQGFIPERMEAPQMMLGRHAVRGNADPRFRGEEGVERKQRITISGVRLARER
ncbi:hypothetical protein NPIL_437281 [Nephila pilipes]|uniref:Uncharacterized protein n=1 Tax=Nephila pilipes TaxID=299642 RepID=A0A8X6Q3B8_NEPPI|nr:hypothetical protein NPIL_437281 [Nephila pilipes]